MLTRRGILVVALLAGCLYMAYAFGGRALNAVVVPIAVAIVAGYVQLRRLDRPSVERRLPAAGFPGATRTVDVVFRTDDPIPATVRDVLGPGLSSTTNHGETTIGDGEGFSYDVTYEGRGTHPIGPLEATVSDFFGFTERTFAYESRDRITVYPPVRSISGRLRTTLHQLAESTTRRQREEFDRLREYDRGDSLRDVHWKSSAKRPHDDLVVKEFTSEETIGELRIAAETHDRRDDELATVTASVVAFLLDAGFSVGLTTPEATVSPASGTDHRTLLLETLATLGPGRVPSDDVDDADLHVYTPADGTAPVLDLGDRAVSVDGIDSAEGAIRARADEHDTSDMETERAEVSVA